MAGAQSFPRAIQAVTGKDAKEAEPDPPQGAGRVPSLDRAVQRYGYTSRSVRAGVPLVQPDIHQKGPTCEQEVKWGGPPSEQQPYYYDTDEATQGNGYIRRLALQRTSKVGSSPSLS